MAVARVEFLLKLSAPHLISETDAATITKLDIAYECSETSPGNPLILRSKVKVTSHKNIAGLGLYTLVSADFV